MNTTWLEHIVESNQAFKQRVSGGVAAYQPAFPVRQSSPAWTRA